MGQTYLRIPELALQDVLRFWSFIDRRTVTECWPWLRGKDWDGYGSFTIAINGKKKSFRAHRIAYFLHYNDDPDQLVVRHLICDNPSCCNGAHLAKGTIYDNTQDSVKKNRRAIGDKNGTRKHPERLKRGQDLRWTKLTEHDVLTMRRLHAKGWKPFQILQFYPHINRSNVYYILNRQTWSHV